MLRRLKWVFDLYCTHHMNVVLNSRKITDGAGKVQGYLERLTVRDDRIYIKGWCDCDAIQFQLGDVDLHRTPWQDRADIAAKWGCKTNVGFQVSLPLDKGDLLITFQHSSGDIHITVPTPNQASPGQSKTKLFVRFCRSLLRGGPGIIKAGMAGKSHLKRQVKTVLGLHAERSTLPLNPAALIPVRQLALPANQKITVIVPVYNAFETLQTCLARLISHTDLPYRLLLIEDCSSDDRVRPWLRQWVGDITSQSSADITLLENTENCGFVVSVNKGLAAAAAFRDHVVIVNSDAFVPADWASRLLAPIYADDNVATVTPMSNDAEIFSVPVLCAPTPLDDGQVDRLDQTARQLGGHNTPITAPTGVGFCMAMRAEFLEKIPAFDLEFSPGYGEEVDWCNKASQLGGLHVAASNVFVEHHGGQSFGSEKKRKLIARNGAVVSARYPDYDASVQSFIGADPIVTERLALALTYLASRSDIETVPVFIAHAMGGGAENYLRGVLEEKHAAGAVVLRFGGTLRCTIEAHTPVGITCASTDDLGIVRQLIRSIEKRHIVYSCAVGDLDPIEIPELLTDLADGASLEILVHDFFPISPSYTMLDADGVFRGTPVAGNTDPAHQFQRFDGTAATLTEWQTAWGKAMAAAAKVTVFSNDSRAHVVAAYPDVTDRVAVVPHDLHADIPALPRIDTPQRTIGVLGNIGQQKGARVLQLLSQRLLKESNVRLVIIGRVDPAFPLQKSAIVHGSYHLSDIPGLVRKYGINLWLSPSIWPETFSYATHEVLATSLPVIAFDIGAQGDAVRAAENGIVLPGGPEDFLSQETLDRIIRRAQEQ